MYHVLPHWVELTHANSMNVYLYQCWNFLSCVVIFVTAITQSELHFCYKNIFIQITCSSLPPVQTLFLPRQAWRALITNPGGGRGGEGGYLYKPYRYVPPHGVGFYGVLIWKQVYTLPILVWNRGWFSRELSFQFQMIKKEREICEFQIDLNNFFVCALI